MVSASDYRARLGFHQSNRRGIYTPQIAPLATRAASVVPLGYEGGLLVENTVLDVEAVPLAYSLVIGRVSKD